MAPSATMALMQRLKDLPEIVTDKGTPSCAISISVTGGCWAGSGMKKSRGRALTGVEIEILGWPISIGEDTRSSGPFSGPEELCRRIHPKDRCGYIQPFSLSQKTRRNPWNRCDND